MIFYGDVFCVRQEENGELGEALRNIERLTQGIFFPLTCIY